jgi:hypothetical protein
VTVGELCIELIRRCPIDAAIDLELWRRDGAGVLRVRLASVGDVRDDGRVPLQAVLEED